MNRTKGIVLLIGLAGLLLSALSLILPARTIHDTERQDVGDETFSINSKAHCAAPLLGKDKKTVITTTSNNGRKRDKPNLVDAIVTNKLPDEASQKLDKRCQDYRDNRVKQASILGAMSVFTCATAVILSKTSKP